jgi:hypothetical protein
MAELHLCNHCGRHIRTTEARCPFCENVASAPSARSSASSVLFAVAAAATVAACYGAPQRNMQQPPQPAQQQPAPQQAPQPAAPDATSSRARPAIGEARMLADGTLVLELRGDDARDSINGGEFRYPRVHPQYDEVLAHVGPIAPGQRRDVRAF